MRLLDFFRKRPGDRTVVFAGNRIEAELVMRILLEEGFHAEEWADLPAPVYAGPIGMARIVVPPHEGDEAKTLLASLKDSGGVEEQEDANGQ
ncbi:MAG: hypothetical protein JW854_08305 [Actinobacteria bacterium]|nr:hypothetical protein [Actinomycetota bacterium]